MGSTSHTYLLELCNTLDVSSFGDTREEARAAINEALELYFEDAFGQEIIQVADVAVETLSVGTV